MALFSTKDTFFDAAMVGDISELRHCLDKKNFNINMRTAEGSTALHLAIEHGQLEAVRLLLAYKPDLEKHDGKGRTALMHAMDMDRPQITLAVIAAGADPNAHGRDYIYPLHRAAGAGEMDVVKALVAGGADLDARTREHEDTPLHYAITAGRRGIAEYLVQRGARIDIAGRDGKTAAKLAKETGPAMLKVVDPASAAIEYKPPESPSETWDIVTRTSVAKISTLPSLNRKITEIFNFETQERTTISQNIKTGQETVNPAEPFGALTDGIVDIAAEKLQLLGGRVPGPAKTRPRIDDSPIGKLNL
jgi:hypothetical protein